MERAQREAAETRLRERENAEKALDFSDEQFRTLKDGIEGNSNSLGRMFLTGTPTGTYSRTDTARVTLRKDRKEMTISVTMHWKGGLTEKWGDGSGWF